jgi:uncharacterized membrane protein
MKALILTLVPVGILVGAFLFSLVWFHKQRDGLAARYRLWSVSMWLLVLSAVGMAVTDLGFGLLGFIPVLLTCELERRRLSRQLDERQKKHVA